MANEVKQPAIIWGGMYRLSEKGERLTRPVADKSSFGKAGYSKLIKLSDRRSGADPPRNESEMIGVVVSYLLRYASR